MILGSYYFKYRARKALRGDWQTALLVTFFAGFLVTVLNVVQSLAFGEAEAILNSLMLALSAEPQTAAQQQQATLQAAQLLQRYRQAVEAIPMSTWTGMGVLALLSAVLGPMLSVSCCRYYLSRDEGDKPSLLQGLFGRSQCLWRALWLYVRMVMQTFLWSLLLVIPGILAALRYGMAPYFMAQDPSLSAGEALRLSKQAIKGHKLSYFLLSFSFLWWSLLGDVVLTLLGGGVVGLVAAQFVSLAIAVYRGASVAAFYRTIALPGGMEEAMGDMRTRMREAGMDEDDIRRAGFGDRDDNTIDEHDPADGDDEA